MVTKIVMPKFGLQMKEGRIVEWLKKENEEVKKGEPLFIIETEKVEVEVEAPASGMLRVIAAKEGSAVPIGGLVAIIAEPDEELPPINQILEETTRELPTPKPEEPGKIGKPVPIAEKKLKFSPLARKLAEEHEIDITKIKGTGPGGRIVKKDVLRVIEEIKAAPEAELAKVAKVIPMTTIRKRIAQRLSESHLRAVHVTQTMEVDMTEAVKFRQTILPRFEEAHGIRVSFNDILVKAVTKALRKYPELNSTLEEDQIKIFEDVHMGVAVSLEKGLIVPVIRNTDKKSIVEIALAARKLFEKARKDALSLHEVTGGTFTITNLGMYGVEISTPIINPPQSAILGVGKITEKPVVVDRQITIRSIMPLSLSFDHRVVDGALAAQFLQELKQILEKPLLMLI